MMPAPLMGQLNTPHARDEGARRRLLLMVGVVVAAPLATLVSWGTVIDRGLSDDLTVLLMLVDIVLGVVALVVLPRVLHRDSGPPQWLLDPRRERRALRWGLLVIACSAFSGGAFLPALIAVSSLSARRRPTWIAAAVLALMGVLVVGLLLESQAYPRGDLLLVTFAGVGLATVLVVTGLYQGSRRALLHSLRREAATARAGQQARAEQARTAERTRIAREMHDTVSHRLALVALHAGGLEYRDDLTPEQVRVTMGTIRRAVQEASEELANTLTVLRSDGADALPAPTMVDIQRVLEEVVEAGAQIETDLSMPVQEPPATLTSHLHRVVQECLTNALKHAPGQPISVRVDGAVDDGIHVVISNPLPDRDVAARGSRVGLVGLNERVALAGGRFRAEAQGRSFVVRAWLPWQS